MGNCYGRDMISQYFQAYRVLHGCRCREAKDFTASTDTADVIAAHDETGQRLMDKSQYRFLFWRACGMLVMILNILPGPDSRVTCH